MTASFGGEMGREMEHYSGRGTTAATGLAADVRLSSEILRPATKRNHRRRSVAVVLTLMFAISGFCLTSEGNGHVNPDILAAPDESSTPSGRATWECGDSSAPVLNSADVVSFFSLEEGEAAVYGSKDHEVVYNGYLFRFASAGNKAMFEASPLDYMPAWGGFCAWGISNEPWWNADNLGPDADPNVWLITDDKELYFFRTEVPKHKFMENLSRNIFAGDEIWTSWFGGDATPGANATGSPLDTSCLCDVGGCLDPAVA
ncbi:unnamed protein product [Scytosiphon promiscuus]